MVALFPEALTMKDEVGDTPLDIVLSRKDEIENGDELQNSLRKLEAMFSSGGGDPRQD